MIPERLPDGPLWACHACQMIGSEAAAKAHYVAKGHECERIDDDTANEVRAVRQRAHDEFVVGLGHLAAHRRRTIASTAKGQQ